LSFFSRKIKLNEIVASHSFSMFHIFRTTKQQEKKKSKKKPHTDKTKKTTTTLITKSSQFSN